MSAKKEPSEMKVGRAHGSSLQHAVVTAYTSSGHPGGHGNRRPSRTAIHTSELVMLAYGMAPDVKISQTSTPKLQTSEASE
eukprot:CAMPEP_0182940788 /NCGR_PEP_ID=MMETSP0105_2-20130417/47894_1 /TAXON_ID=81532 ORGANISM="Acanthoeca-like sp., Strain 10tr" /NCGR_SAMPLE_ID=MMETSP0105_2 /ASSEMBLY_ACC=CAM_ASM_000205 /LENGTH=80 /DNA_ID=CAMNT_0025080323 /DNA_START=273 /DNA_END=512 /DNA_ORIENTATION=+